MEVPQEFCAAPEAFMKKNVVLQTVPNGTRGLVDVVVVEGGGGGVVENIPTGRVCIMRLRREGDRYSMPAYFCPYQQNSYKDQTTMLGNEALFMFTPTMDGCTLGVGSYGGPGVVQVMHANTSRAGLAAEAWGLDEARAQQRKLQKNLLISELGQGVQTIAPDQYMVEPSGAFGYKSTTFGVHGLGGAWEFYVLKWMKLSAKVYRHGGGEHII